MRSPSILSAAVTAMAATLPHVGAQLSKIEVGNDQRGLSHYTIVFDECVGLHLTDCQDLIQAEVDAKPALFEGLTSLEWDVQTVRTASAEDYFLVGLRTNMAETHVDGILGDGMIWYPYPWCLPDKPCVEIGPWDCDVGTALTVEQCCIMIKASVPDADVKGNMIDCHADPPIGSVSNPVDPSRVCIHVNSENIVVHPPKNE